MDVTHEPFAKMRVVLTDRLEQANRYRDDVWDEYCAVQRHFDRVKEEHRVASSEVSQLTEALQKLDELERVPAEAVS